MRNRKQNKIKLIGVTSSLFPPSPSKANCVTSNIDLPYNAKNIFLHVKMATALGQQAFSAFSLEIALN